MKKPNIDFSQQGIKKFLLYHVEKIVLGLAIILLGVFFWLGFGTEKFSKETPSSLKVLAENAHAKMVKSTSWTDIEKFRQADADTPIRIANLDKITIPVKEYEYEPLLGTKAMTAGLRRDPEILPAKHLMAHSFTATVLATKVGSDPDVVSLLPMANAPDKTEDKLADRGGGIGSGGGAGLEGGGAPTSSDTSKKPRDDGKFHPGTDYVNYHRQEVPGIRPEKVNATTSNSSGLMCDIVAVTGVVNFQDQLTEFTNALAGSQGYYPKRDRPLYRYLQIQRQAEGDTEWSDITDKVMRIQANRYIAKGGGPEVVDPDYFDKVLTSLIPTMTQIDYRDFSSWPMANLKLPDGFEPTDKDFQGIPIRNFLEYPGDTQTVAKQDNDPAEDFDPFSSDRGLSQPQRPDKNERNQRGSGNRPPRPGDRGSRPPAGGNRPRSSDVLAGDRKGSDFEIYEEAMKSMEKRGDYQLVRFFDVNLVKPEAEPTKYRYRVRLWAADPNNENPEGFDTEADSNRSGRGREGGIGPGGGGGAGLEGGEGEAGGERPGGAPGNKDKEEEDTSVYVAVTDLMKHPTVRSRINNDKEPRPKDRDDLKYAAYSPWSEPTEWVTVGKPQNAEFYAGKVVPPKSTRINDQYINEGEPAVNIAAVKWDTEYGTRVPANREARRADVLTFNSDAHVLHPVDWTVRKVEGAKIDTDATVVDIIGGEEIRGLSSSGSPMKYSLPGEVLVMAADGSLHVQNEIDDESEYFHLMFQPDETAEIGEPKKAKKEERPNRGRPPGGGRDDDSGF